MHYLTLTAIFKFENPWLAEWINYHIFRGVEHFYLYNNDDDPEESDRILRPYVHHGIVTNIPWPGRIQQIEAYRHAIRNFAQDTYWMGILDLDEFLLPREQNDIRELLRGYERYSGLVVHWNVFGSNGYLQRPSNQIDHFLRRAKDDYKDHHCVKSIVNPRDVIAEAINDPHTFPYENGFAVDENHQRNHGTFGHITTSKIRINHYCVRSRQDFMESKSLRGNAFPGEERNEQFWLEHDRNEVFDDEISRRFGYFSESYQTILRDRLTFRIQRSKNPLTVLLTGSVIQNYPHLLNSGIQNPQERLRDYLCAISLWLKQPEIEHLVYCDTSGFKIPNEIFQSPKFKSLAIDLKGLCVECGKGAAEMASIEYAMQTGNFPAENFFKCTGRLFVKNFSEIWQRIAPPENDFYLHQDHNHKWCDTRFFWLNRNMYHRRIRPHLHEMSDYGGPFLEHLYAKYGSDVFSLPTPVFVGRSAYSGQVYHEDYPQELQIQAESLIEQFNLLSLVTDEQTENL